MNAASLTAFHQQGQLTREALHPGAIKLGGVSYDGAVVVGEIKVVPRSDGGGTMRVQDAQASIPKTNMEHPPAKDAKAIINGVEFAVRSVDGQNDTDTAWIINAARFLS